MPQVQHVCSTCGAPSDPAANFCSVCGTKLRSDPADAPPPAKHERKLVTLLFADLKGSTRAISGLDAEGALLRLLPLVEEMRTAVFLQGGSVIETRGDGILACFGGEKGTHDHAFAATRAALDIRRRCKAQANGSGLPVRTGIHTGEVVLSWRNGGLSGASGSAVHLASRLEQVAEPNTILLSNSTFLATSKKLEARPRGRLVLKGFDAPVETWELIEPVGQLRWRARRESWTTPFLGRTDTLEAIRRLIADSKAGHGGIIAVAGAGGSGKSRLLHEALTPAIFRDHSVWIAEAEAASQGSPYAIVRSLIRQRLGLTDEAPRSDVRAVSANVLTSLHSRLGEHEDALRTLLNVDSQADWAEKDPLWRKARLRSAFIDVCRLQASVRPLVILIDDLQWCDEESRDLIQALGELAPQCPIAIVTAQRIAPGDANPADGTFPHILADLSQEDGSGLVDALVGHDPGTEEIRERILAGSGGSPLFIEQTVLALVRKGVLAGETGALRLAAGHEPIEIPSSVQAVINARIDGLDAEARQVLIAASVVGRQFPVALLPDVAGLPAERVHDIVEALLGDGLIRRIESDSTSLCEFQHEFLKECAYALILDADRKELHARALKAGEFYFSNRLTDWLGFLSHHARLAERHEEGLRYSRLAAEQAVRTSSYRAALDYCEAALAHIKRLPKTRENQEAAIDLRLLLRVAAAGTSEFRTWIKHIDAAKREAEAIGDLRRRLTATIHKTWALNFAGSADEAVRSGESALELARDLRIGSLEAISCVMLGQANYAGGQYRRAADILGGAIQWLSAGHEAERIGTTGNALVTCLVTRSNALASMGRFREARRDLDHAARIAKETASPFDELTRLYGEGMLAAASGEFAQATVALQAAFDLARTSGSHLFTPLAASLLGPLLASGGRIEAAESVMAEAIKVADLVGHLVARTASTVALASVRLAAGDAGEAVRLAGEAQASALFHGHYGVAGSAMRVLAQSFVALDPSDYDRPMFLLNEAIELAAEREALPALLAASEAAVKIALRHERRNDATNLAQRAIEACQDTDLQGSGKRFSSLLEAVPS